MVNNELEMLYGRFVEKGDLGALAEVFDQVAPDLARLAAKLVSDPSAADDLVQETFLTAMERPGTYDSGQPLVPWLVGILVNRSRSTRRTEGRAADHDRLMERSVDGPHAEATRKEHTDAVAAAVRELPESLRLVVEAKLAGTDSSHIASQLGISQGALRGRMHRALQVMRAALPPSLATLFAVVFIHSPGLANVRVRVLTQARLHPLVKTASGVGGALTVGSIWMTKSVVVTVAVLTAALLAVIGLQNMQVEQPAPLDNTIVVESDPAPSANSEPENAEVVQQPVALLADRAEAESPDSGSDAAASPPSLSGVVVDQDNKPVPHAAIRVWTSPNYWFQSQAPSYEVEADAQGAFSLTGLGKHFAVTAYADSAYCSQRIDAKEELAEDATGLVLRLEPATSIHGVVLDPAGRPVENAEVWGTFKDTPAGGIPLDAAPEVPGLSYSETGLSRTMTDRNGAFHLDGLSAGNILLHAKMKPYMVYREWHKGSDEAVEITLDAGLSIRGRVVDSQGAPAKGATVRMFPHANLDTVDQNVLTDSDGRFQLVSLKEIPAYETEGWGASNALTVLYEGHAIEVVQPLQATRDGNAEVFISLQEECVLAGRVVNLEGEPVVGVKVRIEGERDMFPGYSIPRRTTWEWSGDIADVETDKDGAFQFAQLYAGEYDLIATAPDDKELFTKVKVAADTTDLEVQLDANLVTQAILSGSVVDAITGQPITEFIVTAMLGGKGSNHPFTDVNGHFEVRRFAGDSIELRANADGYSQTVLRARSYPVGVTELSIKLLPSRALDLSLVDGNGKQLQGGSVSVTNSKGRQLWLPHNNMSSTSLSFRQGKLHLKDLPAELVTLHINVRKSDPIEIEVDLTAPYEGEFEIVVSQVEPIRIQLFVIDHSFGVDPVELKKHLAKRNEQESGMWLFKNVFGLGRPLLGASVEITALHGDLSSPEGAKATAGNASIEPLENGRFKLNSWSGNQGSSTDSWRSPEIGFQLHPRNYLIQVKSDGYRDFELKLDLTTPSSGPRFEIVELVPVK